MLEFVLLGFKGGIRSLISNRSVYFLITVNVNFMVCRLAKFDTLSRFFGAENNQYRPYPLGFYAYSMMRKSQLTLGASGFLVVSFYCGFRKLSCGVIFLVFCF